MKAQAQQPGWTFILKGGKQYAGQLKGDTVEVTTLDPESGQFVEVDYKFHPAIIEEARTEHLPLDATLALSVEVC